MVLKMAHIRKSTRPQWVNNIPALLQIMPWCRSGDNPLSESMLVQLTYFIYASLGLNALNAIWELKIKQHKKDR